MAPEHFKKIESVLSVVTADSVTNQTPSDRVTGAMTVDYGRLSVHLSGAYLLSDLLTLPGKPSRQGCALSGCLTC